ncbi:MAG TPA: hypothetical protein VGN57_15105 [Pirellulaceae bacterium]|jgi:hypothetical protein|nr:hypothetical protein [Pirellulaceae bacterium]
MTKSRFRSAFFAAPAILIAILASVVFLAAVAAWERASVGVYEATPTESLWLLKAGDIADASVDLGATNFEERIEKRIEGVDRAVLEYVFDAGETGIAVKTRLIERATEELASAEATGILIAFGGKLQDLAPVAAYGTTPTGGESGRPEIAVRDGRTLFIVHRGTYVYTVESSANFGSEYLVLAAIQERTSNLDRPGVVLPLRTPVVEPRPSPPAD